MSEKITELGEIKHNGNIVGNRRSECQELKEKEEEWKKNTKKKVPETFKKSKKYLVLELSLKSNKNTIKTANYAKKANFT